MMRKPIVAILSTVFAMGGGACKKQESAAGDAPSASAAASAQATAAASAPVSEEEAFQRKYYAANRHPVPTGPKLAIVPGEGVGPIHFGATVATIERLMDMPCEVREENACRYIGRAVEFYLKDGVVNEIRIHRLNRFTTPKPRIYGLFNGGFVSGANLNMYREAVMDLVGKPNKVEPVADGGENHTVEVHDYDNMRLEYDRIFNGNVVLSGIILTAPTSDTSGTRPTASAAPASSSRPQKQK